MRTGAPPSDYANTSEFSKVPHHQTQGPLLKLLGWMLSTIKHHFTIAAQPPRSINGPSVARNIITRGGRFRYQGLRFCWWTLPWPRKMKFHQIALKRWGLQCKHTNVWEHKGSIFKYKRFHFHFQRSHQKYLLNVICSRTLPCQIVKVKSPVKNIKRWLEGVIFNYKCLFFCFRTS